MSDMKYKNPSLTADAIVLNHGKVLLIKRGTPPYKGMLAIPGGFVSYGETVESAAIRETKEETGIDIKLKEILGVYSDPKRDPRKHIVTVVFIAKPTRSQRLKPNHEVKSAGWYDIKTLEKDLNTLKTAADHGKILNDFLKWLKTKGTFWSGRG